MRLVYLAQLSGTPLLDVLLIDADTYDRFARRILAGTFKGEDVYAVNVLYPWFVAGAYALGKNSLLLVLQLQALLDATTCALAAWAAARLFDRASGLACGLLLAFCGPLVFYAGALLTPTLATFLATCALAALVAWQGNGRLRAAALGGALVGLATLARGNAVLFVPLALPAFLQARRGFKPWLVFASCALVPPGLATLRNLLVAGSAVPVAANYAAFWIGHNPAANGLYVLPPWAASGEFADEVWGLNAAIARQVGHPMTLAESSRWLFDQGVRWAARNPLAELRLLATKLLYFWNAIEPPTNLSYHFARAWSPLLALLPIGFGVLGPLGLLGAWWGRRQLFPLAWVAAALVTALAFYVSAEYRLPAVPALAMFAGFALVTLARSRTRLVQAAVALPLLALLAWVRPAPLAAQARLHDDYTKVGTLYARKGETTKARAMYERAIAIAPDYAPAWQGLAVVKERGGDETGALAAAQRARALGASVALPAPTQAIADSGLAAAALFQAGDFAGALTRFERLEAMARAAGDTSLAAGLLNNAGLCRLRLGDLAGAADDFARVIAERPGAVKAHYNLARVRAAQSDTAGAIREYEAALAIDPQAPGVRAELDALRAKRE